LKGKEMIIFIECQTTKEKNIYINIQNICAFQEADISCNNTPKPCVIIKLTSGEDIYVDDTYSDMTLKLKTLLE
jgi:hypothetical protein